MEEVVPYLYYLSNTPTLHRSMSSPIPHPLRSLLGISETQDPALPTGIPLDLVELPLTLSATRTTTGPDGKLADRFRRIAGTYRIGRAMVEFEILAAEGTSVPLGNDREILYALLELLARQPSVRPTEIGLLQGIAPIDVAHVLGRDPDKDFYRRFWEALDRLAKVTVAAWITEIDNADEILAGDANPQIPRVRTTRRRFVGHILSVKYSDDGAIEFIQFDPVWVRQGIGGIAAWLDLPLYNSVGPIVQRLYDLAAAQSARSQTEWSYSQDELKVLCGLNSAAGRTDRTALNDATKILVERGVLASGVQEKLGKGNYRYTFQAGPQLTLARLLRGVSLADLADERLVLAALAALGMGTEAARDLVLTAPADALWGIYYCLWTRVTQSESGQIQRPGAFIESQVRKGRNFAAEDSLFRWVQEQMQRGVAPPKASGGGVPKAALALSPGEPTLQQLREERVAQSSPDEATQYTVPSQDPTAVRLWTEMIQSLQGSVTPWLLATSKHVAPVALEGDTLVCWVRDDPQVEAFRQMLLRRIEALLDPAGPIRQISLKTPPPDAA